MGGERGPFCVHRCSQTEHTTVSLFVSARKHLPCRYSRQCGKHHICPTPPNTQHTITKTHVIWHTYLFDARASARVSENIRDLLEPNKQLSVCVSVFAGRHHVCWTERTKDCAFGHSAPCGMGLASASSSLLHGKPTELSPIISYGTYMRSSIFVYTGA